MGFMSNAILHFSKLSDFAILEIPTQQCRKEGTMADDHDALLGLSCQPFQKRWDSCMFPSTITTPSWSPIFHQLRTALPGSHKGKELKQLRL